MYPTPRHPHTSWDTAWLCATLGTTVASAAQPEVPPLEQDKRWLNCIPESGPWSQNAMEKLCDLGQMCKPLWASIYLAIKGDIKQHLPLRVLMK